MFLFCDTETGGLATDQYGELDATQHALLEIAAIKTGPAPDYEPYAEFQIFIKPPKGLLISKEALNHTGFDLFNCLSAPKEPEAIKLFQEFIGDDELIFAGYNCPFDLAFLSAAYERTGLSCQYKMPWFCVLQLARKVLKKAKAQGEIPNHKLGTVSQYLNVELGEEAHNALPDIRATVACARKLKEMEN